jgi:hypothetical protein
MKKRIRKLLLNRETLRRLNSEPGWVRGGGADDDGTETCVISGCPEICNTLRGPNCRADSPEPLPSPSPGPVEANAMIGRRGILM